jgi:cation-transporting ATPase 13A1
LHCTMIITSVVPPELPMELSLAVNTSLARLQKLAIYCTEPYRIPLAGRLDVCCFDKTGTLTSDTYVVRGVVAPEELAQGALTAAEELADEATYVIAGCHQLVRLDEKLDGDQMELAAVKAVKWGMTRDGRMIRQAPSSGAARKEQLRILHRHLFSAAHKRMSAVVAIDTLSSKAAAAADPGWQAAGDDAAAFLGGALVATPRELLLVCKGAPEAVLPLLAHAPAQYEAAYQQLARQGTRVLALAFRRLPLDSPLATLRALPREAAERGLTFAGFLALESPLKEDSLPAIAALQRSQHRVVVITGDAALTACHVARGLGILTRDVLILQRTAGSSGEVALEWAPVDGASKLGPLPWSQGASGALASRCDLVATGAALDAVEASSAGEEEFLAALRALAPHVSVFARVSPRHKEMVLAALRQAGLATLMCGDGTNDLGALKQADVGVSIINSPEHEEAASAARSKLRKRVPAEVLAKLSPAERLRAELMEMEAAQQGSSVVQLGDASIASAFTARSTSIAATVHIVRQGRCTLVTTVQMYKILALNCLISAYSLSALYLFGVKQGDTQATLAGLLIASLFMFIAWAEPVLELAPERPVAHIFSASVMASLAGQLAVHFCSLFAVIELTQGHVQPGAEEMAPDAAFKPNTINTAVFLVGLCMQCNVFGANYRGHPFMQSLRENKAFHRVLGATWLLCLLLASDLLPELGEYFELVRVPLEGGYRDKLLALLLLDTACSWGWERLIRAFF